MSVSAPIVARPFTAAASRTAAPRRGDEDFALVVGVDDYPQFHSLRGAVKDAEEFHSWLCSEHGGGVAGKRTRLVTSTPDPMPVQKHIDDALHELLKIADGEGGGRRLYFYFSGHGAAARDTAESVALLLADWSLERRNLALSSEVYASALTSFGLFRELALFLDCCRTEPPLVGMGITLTPTLATPRTETRKFVAYAAEARHSAYEVRTQSGAWNGVFTKALIGILQAEHGVAATDLQYRLESAVKVRSTQQRAVVVNGLEVESRFGVPGALPMLRITFSVDRVGPVSLFDRNLRLVATHDPAIGPWMIPREPGLHKLVDASGHERLFEHTGGQSVAF